MRRPTISELANVKRRQRWFKSTPGRRLTGLTRGRYQLTQQQAPLVVGTQALQDDDRDLAGGPLAVLVEAWVDAGVLLIQALVFVAIDNLRARPELLAPDLDRDLGMRDEVVIPGRVGRRATLGGDDDVVVAVARVHDRGFPNLAGLGSRGGEDYEVAAQEGPGRGFPAVGAQVVDQFAVEVLIRGAHYLFI